MSNYIHRANAAICGLMGLFSLFVAGAVVKLTYFSNTDLPPDEYNLVPKLTVFCIAYGLTSILYAYCRFFWDRENNKLLQFFRRWPVYLLALAAHGMSLVWVIPVLFGMTDLRRHIAFPIGAAAFLNIMIDSSPFLEQLFKWLWSAMRTKIKKKNTR